MKSLSRRQHAVLTVFLLTLLAWLMMFTPVTSTRAMAAGSLRITTVSGGQWKKTKSHYKYVVNGKAVTGWNRIDGKVYYLRKKTGYRVTGMVKIGQYYYYFSSSGQRKTGIIKIKGKRYWFNKKNEGRRTSGWLASGSRRYYFKKSTGAMASGWTKIGKNYYYFYPSTGRMVTGWLKAGGKTYYLQPGTGARVTGTLTMNGVVYSFDASGVLYAQAYEEGASVYSAGRTMYRSTVRKMLQTALLPVGRTMYVYGGGWNLTNKKEDAAYITTRTLGVSPKWEAFFQQQTSSYNYRDHYLKDVDKGLDCSGYVGWVLYNTFMKESGLSRGFVMQAQYMARNFAGYGWGTYTSADNVKDHKAGDIMSLASGHVYIVIGECSDGSVVLVHSSPNGVQLSGTCAKSGKKNSKALALANRYMKKYFPAWYSKYPDNYRGKSYLTSFSQMRWYLTGESALLSDPEGLTNMSAEQVLRSIFNES